MAKGKSRSLRPSFETLARYRARVPQDEGSEGFASSHVTALKPPSTTTMTPVTLLLL
jgi:hypothetical protein